MKLKEIKRNGYYTDGERVFYKFKKELIVFTGRYEGERYIHTGVRTALVPSRDFEVEVRKVESDEEFQNGDIKIIDTKTLDTLYIDPQITYTQFENGVEPNYKYLRKIRKYGED